MLALEMMRQWRERGAEARVRLMWAGLEAEEARLKQMTASQLVSLGRERAQAVVQKLEEGAPSGDLREAVAHARRPLQLASWLPRTSAHFRAVSMKKEVRIRERVQEAEHRFRAMLVGVAARSLAARQSTREGTRARKWLSRGAMSELRAYLRENGLAQTYQSYIHGVTTRKRSRGTVGPRWTELLNGGYNNRGSAAQRMLEALDFVELAGSQVPDLAGQLELSLLFAGVPEHSLSSVTALQGSSLGALLTWARRYVAPIESAAAGDLEGALGALMRESRLVRVRAEEMVAEESYGESDVEAEGDEVVVGVPAQLEADAVPLSQPSDADFPLPRPTDVTDFPDLLPAAQLDSSLADIFGTQAEEQCASGLDSPLPSRTEGQNLLAEAAAERPQRRVRRI